MQDLTPPRGALRWGFGWSAEAIEQSTLDDPHAPAPPTEADREALANAIRHGCGGDPTKKVECCVTYKEPGEIVAVIRDPGPGFDTTHVPDPMAAENIFKTSGRGVVLINQVMDAVQYRDGGREVAMRKTRTPEPQ